jgi:hypothetical protein
MARRAPDLSMVLVVEAMGSGQICNRGGCVRCKCQLRHIMNRIDRCC